MEKDHSYTDFVLDSILSPEYKAQKLLREQDIKSFWIEFEKFRDINTDYIFRVESCLKDINTQLKTPLTNTEFSRGVESILVFTYGTGLAHNLRPGLTHELEFPDLRVVANSDHSFSYHHKYNNKTKKFEDVCFQTNLNYIISPFGYNLQTKPWRFEEDQTVSAYLNDVHIVNLVLVGAEEYAHHVFYHLKDAQKVVKIKEKDIPINWRAMKKMDKDYDTADLLYHTQDIERRALEWQLAVVNKYLPNWSWPTRDLIKEVGELRIKRQEENKKWYKRIFQNFY